MSLAPYLERLALDSATPPTRQPVPAEDAASFVRREGASKLGWRALRRRWVLWASGQRGLLRPSFPPGLRRLLWLYEGENQIGDALMDLAPRSLLREHGIAVDLLAAPTVARLFDGDPWFGRVTTDAADLQGQDHDFALVLSLKHRPLRSKRQHFLTLPWTSVHGHYTGPNFHRGLLATQRLADLLDLRLSVDDLQRHAHQKLGPLAPLPPAVHAQALHGTIALAVGGVREDRIYPHWHAVVEALVRAGQRRIVLVGSDNGRAQAQALAAGWQDAAQVLDLTARLSLQETRSVIAHAGVLACADGGLMHLGLTTATPVVSLFTQAIDPAWRLPQEAQAGALRAAGATVSDLAPHAVAQALLRALELPR